MFYLAHDMQSLNAQIRFVTTVVKLTYTSTQVVIVQQQMFKVFVELAV